MRNIIAVLMGAIVAFGIVSVGDALAGTLFALPPGLDPKDPNTKATIEAAIAKAPLGAMLVMAAGYFVAAFVGGFIARKIASTQGLGPSMIVGALVLAATLLNFAMLKHPMMMVVLGALAPLPGAFLGGKTAGGGTAGSTAG